MRGRVVEIPSLALDLDTADDLRELAAELSTPTRALAPATAAALAQLGDELVVSGPVALDADRRPPRGRRRAPTSAR